MDYKDPYACPDWGRQAQEACADETSRLLNLAEQQAEEKYAHQCELNAITSRIRKIDMKEEDIHTILCVLSGKMREGGFSIFDCDAIDDVSELFDQ